jgi:hypothetical protein
MMTAMATQAKRLTDMVIDEVSFVDRAANQHSTVAFAKNDGANLEDEMPVLDDTVELYDVDGDEVDPGLLEHGDVVYAADGTELVYVDGDEDDIDALLDDGDEVEKAGFKAAAQSFKQGRGFGWNKDYNAIKPTKGGVAAATGASNPGAALAGHRFESGMVRGGAHVARNKKKYAAGAGALTAAGAGGAAYGLSKSLGEQVLEELSKAASTDEREAIIAKAMNEVEIAKADAAAAWEAVEAERDARLEMEFIGKAEDYNLPIAPGDFGPILKRLVERMEPNDIEVLDQIFKAAGDMLYEEVGYVGGGDNASVLDTVNAAAQELVGKSDLTSAEAQVALLEQNPELYDAFLAEQIR